MIILALSPDQESLLVSLISLMLVFISPLISLLTYRRNVKKDRSAQNEQLEKRFDSIEKSLNDLNSSIKSLQLTIEHMNKDLEKTERDENELSKKVQSHEVALADHEARINHLEEK